MTENETVAGTAQTGFTISVPASYKEPAERQGSIERLDYASFDYAGNGSPVTKTSYVYLPYGYDDADDTRYDIVYLMHGWGGHAGEYFEHPGTKEMYDHLVEHGDIQPVIIVSATFYHDGSDADFSGSVRELRAFHRDFEDKLMPAVEGRYRTYATDVTPEGLAASRDHRAFGGFSLGSVTTWLALCHDFDYIRYFLPMSGSCWYFGTYGDFQTERNVDFVERVVRENDLDERGYFVYFTTGTQDGVKGQSEAQAAEMLARGDAFGPEHFVFYEKDGGRHDLDAVQEYLYNALPTFFGGGRGAGAGDGAPEARTQDGDDMQTVPYTVDTPIADVIDDAAFEGRGRLLFPTNGGYYSGTTLGDLRLAWYSNIDPDMTVAVCNHLRERMLAGETVFFDIYTDEEKALDPAKADTALVFFRGGEGARFAICNAGGGHVYVGALHDSLPHALELSRRGYNAFALVYRPGWETANEDLARAIGFVFAHAEELGVDTSCYSLWGGSAGARMAASVGSLGPAAFGGDDLPHAGCVVMQYTGHRDFRAGDPATYACCGTADGIADWRVMERRLEAMSALGIPTEFHAYAGLPHGFGLGTGTVAEGWLDDAVAFWERQMPVALS